MRERDGAEWMLFRLVKRGREEKRGGKVTRIVTTFEYDEKIVKKWFVNPDKVIKNLGGSFVKVVPKETKKTKVWDGKGK